MPPKALNGQALVRLSDIDLSLSQQVFEQAMRLLPQLRMDGIGQSSQSLIDVLRDLLESRMSGKSHCRASSGGLPGFKSCQDALQLLLSHSSLSHCQPTSGGNSANSSWLA